MLLELFAFARCKLLTRYVLKVGWEGYSCEQDAANKLKKDARAMVELREELSGVHFGLEF